MLIGSNESPLVSVYIPTYNRLSLLKRAVESVLLQSYENIELVVVDDNSTDGSYEYLQQLALVDDRVVSIRKSGAKGASASRNIAIKAAKGILITGLDDDDYFLKDHIKKLVFGYRSDYSCVFARFFSWKDIFLSPICFATRRVSFRQLKYFNIIGNQVLIETTRLRNLNGFDENLGAAQDYDLWLRVTKKWGAARMLYLDTYRVDVGHGYGRISDDSAKKCLAYISICKKHGFNENTRVGKSFLLRIIIRSSKKLRNAPLLAILNPLNLRHILSHIKHKTSS